MNWLHTKGRRWLSHSRDMNGEPMLTMPRRARASAYTGETAETSANTFSSCCALSASASAPSCPPPVISLRTSPLPS